MKWCCVALIWGFIGLAAIVAYFAHDMPQINDVVAFKRRPAITFLASDGSLIGRTGDFRGEDVVVEDLPPHVVHAILATEDRRFYHHYGVDPLGLARAMLTNIWSGRLVQGGSTITQQLAKNLFLTPDRTFKRKVQEAVLAFQLESRYTKNQILSAYLNRVYLGAGTYGLDAAARLYFDKPATELNARESAILAGLLKAPSRYAPSINPDETAARTQVVLQAMVDAGYMTSEDKKALEDIPHPPRRKPVVGDGVRYFVDWVADQTAAFVGYDIQDLTVVTTLDPDLQRMAEQDVGDFLDKEGKKLDASQAALVSVSPDGAVRAMIGGRTYRDSQFNRATQALRQPGSAFKLFVYLAALDLGITPDTVFEDAPFSVGAWQPANFDHEYRGSVSLRDAFAYSLNSVAAQLIDRVGVQNVRRIARQMGITSPLGQDLSLALGTSEVTLLELTGAYAVMAKGGKGVWPYAITQIQDSKGRILYQYQPSENVQFMAPSVVAQMNSLMMGTILYGTGMAAQLDRPAAGKTGTSQDYRDAWFMGFTPDLVTGVWVGNDDNQPMKKVTGGSLPARIWHNFMQEAHQKLPVRPIPGMEEELLNSVVGGDIPAKVREDESPPITDTVEPVDTKPENDQPLDALEKLLGRIVGVGDAP